MEFALEESALKPLVAKAAQLIHSIHYLTLATADENGNPWCSPLNVGYDERLTFYWKSPLDCQHSQNIRSNSRVFFVLFDSRVPVDTGFGIYFNGRAYQLDDDESDIQRGSDLIAKRVERIGSEAKRFIGESPRRVYKAIPEEIWFNSVQMIAGQNIDGRVKIDINWLQVAVQALDDAQ